MPPRIIVFGPTGAVASVAAITAAELGSNTSLAMRNPDKEIPGLSLERHEQGGFERVKADLTDPSSVRAAVTKAGAKHAFIYLVFGPSFSIEHMKPTILALRESGIEYVVFLSSWSVQGDLKAIGPENLGAFIYAQIEISLENIFGANGFVAVRPAWFATNATRFCSGMRAGEILKMPYPDVKYDWLDPADIGRVCGFLLARGPQILNSDRFIYLAGPNLISQRNGAQMIGRAIDIDGLAISSVSDREAIDILKSKGFPELAGSHLVGHMRAISTGELEWYPEALYHEAAGNIERITGRKSTTAQEWIGQNVHLFNGQRTA